MAVVSLAVSPLKRKQPDTYEDLTDLILQRSRDPSGLGIPPDLLLNKQLKVDPEILKQLAALKSGELRNYEGPRASGGHRVPPSLLTDYGVAGLSVFASDGASSLRAIEVQGNGMMKAREMKKASLLDFFMRWTRQIDALKGNDAQPALISYVSFLRELLDLGYKFPHVMDFDTHIRNNWAANVSLTSTRPRIPSISS